MKKYIKPEVISLDIALTAHGNGNGKNNGKGHGYDLGPGMGPGNGNGYGHNKDKGNTPNNPFEAPNIDPILEGMLPEDQES